MSKRATLNILSVLVWAAAGCTNRSDAPTLGDAPSSTSAPNSSAVVSTPLLDSGDETVAPVMVPLEPLPVSTEPFVSNPQWPECVHAGVVEQCSDGWCKIPAGCYVFGTPEDAPGRAAHGEEQTPVTFTYDMEVMQTELTWARYDEITGWPRKIYKDECADDQCPANVSWWEAMLLANLLSERHEPPLERCYELGDGCQREPGNRMYCPNFKLTVPGYRCNGYRLPNQFEWQYIARGGTTTDFYTGNMHNTSSSLACEADSALEGIAWYCGNSAGPAAQPVGTKWPNRWGVYDLFGNVFELLQTLTFQAPGVPVTDPVEPDASGERLTDIAGGNAVTSGVVMQAARRLDGDFAAPRLVRTLGKGTLPQLPAQ